MQFLGVYLFINLKQLIMKGTLRLFLVLCITALSMTLVQAQERTYSGVVKGSDGQPIIGASVEVVGTTVGTSTGLDGDYTIKANQGSKIKFSFLGTKSVTATAGTSSTINVTLEDDATALDEVVVQAFGTAKKKDLTGAVSSIDSKLISSQSNSTLSRALEGAIPGLQVASIDGQPGVDMGIRVRGIGSGTQNNSDALIVIDGVPNTNSNALSSLNPKDIESITVLKDAASTALWGSRGANGVVMVTTKKGQQGRAKVTFEGRWGINQQGPFKYEKIDDPAEMYEWAWQSIYNTARYYGGENYTTNVKNPNMSHEEAALFASQHLFDAPALGKTSGFAQNGLGNYMLYNVPGATYTPTGSGSSASSTMTGAYLIDPSTGKLNPNAELLYWDPWDGHFLQNRFRQEYNVSVSGATDKTDYFISAGYLEDPSYIQGSSFNRYNVRSNINSQITKWLKAGINMAYSRRAVQSPATRYGRNPGSAVANVFRWVNGQNQLIPLYQRNADGSYILDAAGNKQYTSAAEQNGSVVGPTGGPTSTANLDYILNHDKDETISNDINIRGYVEAKFLKDFTFQANLSTDQTFAMRSRYWNPVTGSAVSTGGAWGQNYNEYNNINTQQTLNWAHDYGKHHVDAMIGHEFNWNRGYSLNYKTQSSIIPDFQAFTNFLALNGGATFSGIGGGIDEEALEGYFMRANYNYDNKYYVTASVRTDGSSKFRYNDTRWGTFWSVGGAWRLSGESWLADATWLTDLKLRADYGIMGNQNGVDRYSGYQTWSYGANGYTYSGTNVVPANITLGLGNYVNSGLTWEKKKTFDIGLDFRLWDRFYGTIDYYNITVDDMIWAQPIAISLGQPSIDRNNAKMRNQGIEIELGVDIIKTPDILWSFSVNGTHYTNKIIGVPEGIGTEALNGGWTAGVDAWSKGGGGAVGNIVYLRGKGKDLYNMYLFKYGGVDQASGLPLFASTVSSSNIDKLQKASHVYGDIKEGNVVYTTDYSLATRQEFGSATPKFIGGFSTSFRWKDLDFAATFAFQCGGKFFSNEYALNLYNNQKLAGALSAEMKGNTWTPDNTGAKFPMQMYGTTYTNGAEIGSWMYTDMSLFSASYLNVKNLTLGYNLPQKWMDKIGIGGIRVYASADNVWMWTQHAGIDPRMSLVGGWEVGAYAYPYMRTMSLGVNVTF